MAEDPGEVEQALAGIGEAAGLVHVLDVVLQDPPLVLSDEVDRVPGSPGGPEQVQLQMDQLGVGDLGEDVIGGAGGVVGEAEELPVVVVVAQLEPGRSGHAAGPVQIPRERPPRRRGPGHLAAAKVDPEEGMHDVARPQRVRIRQRGGPGGRVEGLGDEDMTRAGHDPVGVQHRLELGHTPADEAGVLDPGVANRRQRGDGARKVDGQLVAQGEQLDADLVTGHPMTAAVALGAGRGRWANAGPASTPEVPTTAAVVTAVRRKPRRLSPATSSRLAVSS